MPWYFLLVNWTFIRIKETQNRLRRGSNVDAIHSVYGISYMLKSYLA